MKRTEMLEEIQEDCSSFLNLYSSKSNLDAMELEFQRILKKLKNLVMVDHTTDQRVFIPLKLIPVTTANILRVFMVIIEDEIKVVIDRLDITTGETKELTKEELLRAGITPLLLIKAIQEMLQFSAEKIISADGTQPKAFA
jgi:hypothetical protein